MLRYLLVFTIITNFGMDSAWASFSVLHYNIKELDSSKLISKNEQLNAVKQIVSKYPADIYSINELQYDLKDVPNSDYKTIGENLKSLGSLIGIKNNYEQSFHPANTGLAARQRYDGTYYTVANTAEARAHADQVNFGVFPAQYSTGALFKFKKLDERIVTNVKWKDFNPKADFSKFKLANGEAIPSDIQLFDKNFSDITVQVEGKPVHIILLHTVPSYHFGNKFSINDFRNAEQLRFMEWYLTGKTDYKVNLKGIKPLPKSAYFVAMGDFNVSIFDQSSEGSEVLNNIMSKSNIWTKLSKDSFTNESGHFAPNPMRLLLDYIVTSKNIKTVKGNILLPKSFKRVELGCKKEKNGVRNYRTRDGKICQVKLDLEYDLYKQASDHYPLYGEFELK